MKSIKHGYSCDAGQLEDGWFAAVSIIEDRDREFTRDIDQPGLDRVVELLPGKSHEAWEAATVSQPRRLLYLQSRGESGRFRQEKLTDAERIWGPAAAKGVLPFPVLAWCERTDALWKLKAKKNQDIKTLFETRDTPQHPAVGWHKGQIFAAVGMNNAIHPRILIFNESGRHLEIAGRRPVLCPAGESLFLLYESSGGGAVASRLRLAEIRRDEIVNQWQPGTEACDFNGDLAYSHSSRALYIVWESAPGLDEGRHRNLIIRRLTKGGTLEPAPGTRQGMIDIPHEAFQDKGQHVNMPPVNPKIHIIRDHPVLSFRRFRYRGHRCFGWDVHLAELENGKWSTPRRVSENPGPRDAGYKVVEKDGTLTGLFPACDNQPNSTRAYNFRVEIYNITYLPDCPVPDEVKGNYEIPVSIHGAGEEPPEIGGKQPDLKLVWGDLHRHTCQSKCMSCIDGSPEDVVRFNRDMLGCRVFTFTDHLQQMGAAEATWAMDRLEEAVGDDGVVIYGCEPGVSPGHHTNFYAVDREIFERLRLIVISNQDRGVLYSEIKKRLPRGTVMALRHYHGQIGEYGVNSSETTETWDPELEVAMEAMQCRGNVMLDSYQENMPLFPNNFLNAGPKIGLVGGSDHTSSGSINPFCLTGFWVRELTPQAIWEAVLKRRTMACSNGKIAIWAELNGNAMGTETSVAENVEIKTSISAPHPIQRACLMKDGVPIKWHGINNKQATFVLRDSNPAPGRHWYVVTAEGESVLKSGKREQRGRNLSAVAHSSPFFVDVQEGR